MPNYLGICRVVAAFGTYKAHRCDLDTLKPDKFVTDPVIDIYLAHLMSEQDKAHADRFHIFPCFLLHLCAKNYPSAMKCAAQVVVEDKDFLVFPVNMPNYHWYLVIVCKGLDGAPPCALVFDSAVTPQSKAHTEKSIATIKSYLSDVYLSKYTVQVHRVGAASHVPYERLQTQRVKVQEQGTTRYQRNNCGLHALWNCQRFTISARHHYGSFDPKGITDVQTDRSWMMPGHMRDLVAKCLTGLCACGCVGVWVCGCVGVWVCGCVGVWVCGCVGVWVCGCVGVWVCGCVGVWVCGCVGVWVCGCVGVWVCGCVGVWVCRCWCEFVWVRVCVGADVWVRACARVRL